MDKTIWKFPIKVVGIQTITMPKNSHVLSIQSQNNNPCIWALVDPNAEREQRRFEIIGTGHPVPNREGLKREFITTFQLDGGAFVGHAFELMRS